MDREPGMERPGSSRETDSLLAHPVVVRAAGWVFSCLALLQAACYIHFMKTKPLTTGDRLKLLRESKNMTRRELAEQSGLNESTIHRIEGGTRTATRPELQTLRRLCLPLGMTLGEVIDAIFPDNTEL